MQQVIWKYTMSHTPGRSEIGMPIGAKILSVQAQRDEIAVWALVNPAQENMEVVRFNKVYTGEPVPRNVGIHLATVQVVRDAGGFWTKTVHVFRARTVQTPDGKIKEV